MFKYKLKDKPINAMSTDYIYDYLENLGIKQVGSFLFKPHSNDELDPFLLDNMMAGIEMLKKHIEKCSNIFIVVDSDADGYTSAAIIYNFIRELRRDIHIDYYIHSAKQHGVNIKHVPVYADLVIIPDAGSNQFDEQEELARRGIDVLILDHHLVDDYYRHDNVVIINNQLSDRFYNKSLSGAGVTFKFIQAYDLTFLDGMTYGKYIDLAAVGITSDMMDIRTLDNNFIIKIGLKSIHNSFLHALLEKQSYSVSSTINPTPIDIMFYITPIINGVIRAGDYEDKDLLFKALITPFSTKIYKRMWRGEEKQESLYEYAARNSYNIKNRQNTLLDKVTTEIFNKIEEKGLDQNQLIVYKTSMSNKAEIPKTMTGLVAMRILNRYSKPALVLRPVKVNGETHYQGSGRGKKMSGFPSLKDFLTDSGLVEYSQGHHMAHGAGVKEDNIEELVEYANETLKDIDFGTDEIEVDYVFNDKNINNKMLYQFAEYKSIYGNGIPEPIFAFELTVMKNDVMRMGKDGTSIKIMKSNIPFVKFRDKDLADELSDVTNNGYAKVTLIGKPSLNEYMGHKSVQIIIDHIHVEKKKNFSLF